jgi:hypothetical protein
MASATTIHVDPETEPDANRLQELLETVKARLKRGVSVDVIVVDSEPGALSPNQAAQLLGFSRQHVMRLISNGRLQARRMSPDSAYWEIPIESVVEFKQERDRRAAFSDDFSRSLTEAGAPLE